MRKSINLALIAVFATVALGDVTIENFLKEESDVLRVKEEHPQLKDYPK